MEMGLDGVRVVVVSDREDSVVGFVKRGEVVSGIGEIVGGSG